MVPKIQIRDENIILPETDIKNGDFRGLLGIKKILQCNTLCSNNS